MYRVKTYFPRQAQVLSGSDYFVESTWFISTAEQNKQTHKGRIATFTGQTYLRKKLRSLLHDFYFLIRLFQISGRVVQSYEFHIIHKICYIIIHINNDNRV